MREGTHRWISDNFSSFSSAWSFLIACSFLVFSIRSSHFFVFRPSGRSDRLATRRSVSVWQSWSWESGAGAGRTRLLPCWTSMPCLRRARRRSGPAGALRTAQQTLRRQGQERGTENPARTWLGILRREWTRDEGQGSSLQREGRDGIADEIYTWVEKTEIVIRAFTFSPPRWWRALLVWPREPCLDPRSVQCAAGREVGQMDGQHLHLRASSHGQGLGMPTALLTARASEVMIS